MSRLGAPTDHALLAAKLAPRLELVALQQGQVASDAEPGPVVQVQKVANDVRLPSHIALERQLPAGLPAAPAAPDTPAPPAARLSPAARLIGALLAQWPDAGPLRATAPLWPSARQPANAATVAAALAQAVGRSGLFYESHLREFVAGTRTLAQLAQEPQARWAAPVSPAVQLQRGDQAAQAAAGAAHVPSDAMRDGLPAASAVPVVPMPVAPALPLAAQAADAAPASAPGAALPTESTPAQGEPDAPVPPAPAPRANAVSTDAVPLADARRVRAAYRAGEGASAATFEADAATQRAEAAATVRHGAAPAVPSALPQAAELIHPQAATVVHQQLDLLATAVFRWSGQAWPEVPMDWSIQQEEGRPRDEAAQQDEARRWSTTVALELPRLGPVELRLTLAGGAVQAQFVTGHAATAERLRAHGAALEQRFESAGLRLDGLRVSEREG
ncbi:flagellar hook-length control protein FliK [Variovorax sp. RA8]|uniref:flagellar hook-length control protein FliK n=1 Tax=Variovorax sp. (strain JCM 16519 / RA8) TaxID=662548 RepID=UPI001317B206|nr:flagellar hook-length control protein FliK [Variovorax sp. RA8]VTU20511.1 Flagellar hook-length control protein FliK [Variovorax sp. RA8]